MLKQQTEDIIKAEMKEIEEFQRKSNMSLFESLFSSMWQTKGEKVAQTNNILEQNLKAKKQKRKMNKWTEKDTNNMMDLMEVALQRVKEKMAKKRKVGLEDEGLEEEMEVEQLEDQVLAATNETMTVLKEITSVMQVIAEVTIEEHEEEQEEEQGNQDSNGSFEEEEEDEDEEEDGLKVLEDGVVGEALAGQPEADQWTGLVRRLSTKRSQRRRKKSQA